VAAGGDVQGHLALLAELGDDKDHAGGAVAAGTAGEGVRRGAAAAATTAVNAARAAAARHGRSRRAAAAAGGTRQARTDDRHGGGRAAVTAASRARGAEAVDGNRWGGALPAGRLHAGRRPAGT